MTVAETENAIKHTDGVIESYGAKRCDLIHILQDVQEEYDYLPRPALERVSEKLNVSLPEVLRVATFYAAFSLEPRGEHLITVCTGTACHVKGAPRLIDALQRDLGLEEGQETTDDMKFTLREVRCVGCCSLAPVLTVDGRIHGNLAPEDISDILEDCF